MSLPFARSERSLQTDDYRTALISLSLGFPLFVAWIVWFLVGDMPLYSVSDQLSASEDGSIVASFALDEPPDLALGAPIRVRLQFPDEDGLTTVPATVWDIVEQDDGTYDVEVYPDVDQIAVASLETIEGRIAFDNDDRSPFEYLLTFRDEP